MSNGYMHAVVKFSNVIFVRQKIGKVYSSPFLSLKKRSAKYFSTNNLIFCKTPQFYNKEVLYTTRKEVRAEAKFQ